MTFMRWLSLLLILAAVPAAAQDFPKLTGRVVDAANIIPDDQEAALAQRLEGIETASSRQLVVATIPDLQGYPIEDYGYRLGRAWGIGQKGANNGIMLLVAPNDHKVRIEVGYGLEPIMTDALSNVIINTRILPAFKAGDMPRGIESGVDAIAAQLQAPPEQAEWLWEHWDRPRVTWYEGGHIGFFRSKTVGRFVVDALGRCGMLGPTEEEDP